MTSMHMQALIACLHARSLQPVTQLVCHFLFFSFLFNPLSPIDAIWRHAKSAKYSEVKLNWRIQITVKNANECFWCTSSAKRIGARNFLWLQCKFHYNKQDNFDILWHQVAQKTHLSTFSMIWATFCAAHQNHCY